MGVAAERFAHDPRAECCRGRAELVRGEHPTEHDGALIAEQAAAQRHRGRHGGHPVEPVDDDEQHHAGVHFVAEQPGQQQQPDAAERVERQQQNARIDPVGEPARGDRADDVEHPDHHQQPGRGGGGQAVVVGGRHEVNADQAVGGGAADGERAGQGPERPGVRRRP